jgi:hypothetical protein
MKFLFSKVLRWTATALFFGIFVYGMIQFPDAPIHPCGLEYCGKHGVKVTREIYEVFLIWERTLLIATALLALHGLAGSLLKKMRIL